MWGIESEVHKKWGLFLCSALDEGNAFISEGFAPVGAALPKTAVFRVP